MLDALLQLYARTDVVGQAIAEERKLRSSHHQTHAAELAAVVQEIGDVELAIGRYLKAFEAGSLDAGLCGERVRELKVRVQQLDQRRDDLTRALEEMPGKPSQKAIDRLRSCSRTCSGTGLRVSGRR